MPELTYLSLGWGVQSFAIAAMIANGDLPMIDLAIHADTGHELQGTYDHAAKYTPWLGERGLKVVTVEPYGSRANDVVREDWGKDGAVMIPAFTANKKTGKPGQVSRQCTHDWKIMPIRRHLRELVGQRPKPESVECWQGISLDEWHRMRSSDVKYITNYYPLVERRISRAGCVAYLEEHGLDIPPKSACTFCPYHSIDAWKRMKARGGPDWEEAVEADQVVRDKRPNHTLYIHPYRVPLEEAVQIPEDVGASQLTFDDLPCDGGVCWV